MNNAQNNIFSGATPAEVKADLLPLVDFQDNGLAPADINNLLKHKLVPHLMKYDRSGFQSMFNSFPESGAELGANLALAYNQGVTNWQVSPGGAMLEELCCQRLCRLFGLPETADATFMYSGTYANQEALYLALHKKAEQQGFDYRKLGLMGFGNNANKLAILASKDAHLSVRQAAYILGLGEECHIPLEVDQNRRIDIDKLAQLLVDLKSDIDVCCIIATAGTTSAGAVDPIEPLAHLARRHNAWLHVDGAYGLAYSLVPEYKPRFAGIALADSVSWDPHKQLGIPIPNSLLFVNNADDFYRIAQYSHYFNREEDIAPNPGFKSPPTTRPMSALPLVTSLLSQGVTKVIERLRMPLQNISQLAIELKQREEFQLFHEPDAGILCFRITPAACPLDKYDELQDYVYNQIMQSGQRSISITKLDGITALRLLAISPAVTLEALLETIDDIIARSKTFVAEARS